MVAPTPRRYRERKIRAAERQIEPELATRPSERQVTLARVALDAGATAVVGAHPHVLQPVVRAGGRVVAYSLGNFVFPSHSAGTTRTGILELRLGAGRVLSHAFRPATIRGATPVLG